MRAQRVCISAVLVINRVSILAIAAILVSNRVPSHKQGIKFLVRSLKVINRVGKIADFGHKLARRLVINRLKVLRSGPYTQAHFFGNTPPGPKRH